MRELVTVQAGEEANWVGAYFWALQAQEEEEEEDTNAAAATAPSVLYESTAASSAWREPRVLLFDVPEAFNPFRAPVDGDGGGGNTSSSTSRAAALTWKGGVDVHHVQQQQPQPQPQQAMMVQEDAVPSVWAEAWQGLRSWPQVARHCVGHTAEGGGGAAGWSDARGGDQLRRLLEGCDAPQGAHVVVDLCGPWLGYGAGAAEEWGEEVGGGALACLALHRSAGAGAAGKEEEKDASWRLVEAALGVHRLLETGALVLPLAVEQRTGGDDERRARQAAALAAASGAYARGGGCHMREWVHGVRSGGSSGSSVASLELGFPFPPFPPSPSASASPSASPSLRQLLQPADPRTALDPTAPPSGLLTHLVPLTPSGSTPSPLRRVSGVVSLYGCGASGLGAVNDAAKYYPWFQPQLNYAEPDPFPVRRWPFPAAWRATAAATATQTDRTSTTRRHHHEDDDDEAAGAGAAGGYGALCMAGCTSATLPFLHELSGALRARGPGARARLREERGLLDEDVAEVEEALEQLWAPFELQEGAAAGLGGNGGGL